MSTVTEALASNVFKIGRVSFEATGDRILVMEDPFKSGYECETCGGSGKLKCDNCEEGITSTGKKCSFCEQSGRIKCPVCLGKGGLIVVPDNQQARPTTGRIVSIGEDVKKYGVGESCLYASYCGHLLELGGYDSHDNEIKVNLRVIRESEMLCRITGQLELRKLKKSTTFVET